MGLTASSCKKNFVQKPNNQPQIRGTYGKRTRQKQGTMILRWQLGMCDVENDLKKMKAKGWMKKMRNREQWRLVM
jgi:hypothetical protein